METRVVAAAAGVALLAVASQGSPQAWAQSPCPTAAVTGKGITLSSPAGRTSDITWLADGRTRIADRNPAAPRNFPRETISFRGLIPVELTRPSGKAQLKFDGLLDTLFPLSLGKQHELYYVSEAAGRAPVRAKYALAVLEELKHTLGTCTYDAVLVGHDHEQLVDKLFAKSARFPPR